MRKHLLSHYLAWRGLVFEIWDSPNLRIQIFIMFATIIAAVLFDISAFEWLILIILFAGTLSSELVNSAIEHLSDFVTMEISEKIRLVKDVAAASVLIWAIFDVIAGLIIFVPKMFFFVYIIEFIFS